MTPRNPNKTRRIFLKTAAGLAAFPLILPARARGANARIQVGVVGLGGRGMPLLRALVGKDDARIVALCDVHPKHYRDYGPGEGPMRGTVGGKSYMDEHGVDTSGVWMGGDFREVCSRQDIDAVVVATPDHWHALITLTALRSGKDVYCEKPVTHLFHEGQQVYREVAARKAIFQAGSQQRSDPRFRHAVELIRNGHIGKLKYVEVGLPPGYEKPMGDPTVTTPPETLDYAMWCGPSPELPYMRARHHRWWRGHRAYGGGVLMDWIGHHNDIAHWALDLDASGPLEVRAVDWTYPETDIYNTPHLYEIHCTYADGVTSTISSQNPIGTKWVGEDGWVFVRRGALKASDPRWTKPSFAPGPVKVYKSRDHIDNFLEGVRTRKACIAPAETAHRSITPGHLGYVSQALGRGLKWDPVKEECPGDDEANRLLQAVDYRAPWSLEGVGA